MKKLELEKIFWALYAVVAALAFLVWGQELRWDFGNLTVYNVFPLFGLLAFSLMWVHYVSGFIRDKLFPGQSTKRSFEITSWMVLALLILHPVSFIGKLKSDGYGLPPESYKLFLGEASVAWVMLGTVAFAGLLLFELKRWFGKKPWWKFVTVINDVAILLVVLHSFALGRHVQSGWFRAVWIFYSITLALCIVRIYLAKIKTKKS